MDPRHELWRRLAAGTDEGVGLSWLLHEGQVDLRAHWIKSAARRYVVCCSRRYGKSFWLVVEAIEQCLRKPNSIVLYAAPTAKQVHTIVVPHVRTVLATCPRELKPKHNVQMGSWRFPNGSELRAAGCDGQNHDRLRGAACHLGIVDEAGMVDELRYVVQDVLLPMTIDVDGRLLIASTPSPTPAHAFKEYCIEAEAVGSYTHRTIYQAPHIRPGAIEEFQRESGGAKHSTWKREYLAEHVVDETRAVLPEFSEHRARIVVEPPTKPEVYHTYVGADLGWHDLTAVLLAYFDFDMGKLVVEDEVVLSKATSDVIVEHVAAKERELWGSRRPPVDHPRDAPRWEPVTRVADAPELVIADIRRLHRTAWRVTRKDDADAALNALRIALAAGRIIIHPRCVKTISHCEGAIWNHRRTDYERSDAFGHFDAVDALVYLWRCVEPNRNPYPDGYHDRHVPRDSAFRRRPLEDRRERAKLMKLVRR